MVVFKTPRKSNDVREHARPIIGPELADAATARVLFRKISKGLDDKDFVIAQHER